jgi:tetratricopeptide (TPR) repeat protein
MPFSRFLVAATVAIALSLSASVDLPRENERWTRIELDDYVIYSSARDGITREVAERLQLMRDGLALITRLNVHPPQPVTVLLFPSEKMFGPYRDAAFGRKLSHLSGVFGGSRDEGFILLNTEREVGIDRSVYHELTHCFMRNNSGGELPVWFNEGVAEFYSTFEPYGRDKLHVGRPIADHLQRLQSRGLIPLARLFRIDYNSPEYSERDRTGDFYAESWLLVHYLMIGNAERHEHLAQFLTLLTANEPPESAVQKAFGIPIERLDNELFRYSKQPTMSLVEYTVAQRQTHAIPDPAPAPRGATLLALGRFLEHTPTPDEARPFFEAAARANPESGDAYAALAELSVREGKTAEEPAFLEKATRLGTSDANAYARYAMQLTASQPEAALAMLERAAAMNPRSAMVYSQLAYVYDLTHQPEKAIAAYAHSLEIEPRQEAALNLVSLYAREGKRDAAMGVTAKYLSGESQNQAREILAMLDVRRAYELAEAGKPDEALAAAHAARDAATTDAMKKRIGDAVGQLEKQISRNQQVAEINRAIALANAGRMKQAVAMLDGVLPQITDAELQAKTKELRAKFAAAAKKR